MKYQRKYHIFYKITNTINDRFYYGIRSTNDLSDGYMGSGIAIKKAIKKYGRKNFTKNILFFCECREHLHIIEREIVTETFIASTDNYNICVGGIGALPGKDHFLYGMTGESHPAYGYRHSDETKKLMSKLKKGQPGLKGKANPQFGHIFTQEEKNIRREKMSTKRRIYYPVLNKNTSVDINVLSSYLDQGWELGISNSKKSKKILSENMKNNKYTKNTIWINNGSSNKRVTIEKYLLLEDECWSRGRLPFNRKH